jgi:hypothetical protein
MSTKTRIQKLEMVSADKQVKPSYAVRQSDGYLLCYADGHKERVNELPARVKCYGAEASPLVWDGDK